MVIETFRRLASVGMLLVGGSLVAACSPSAAPPPRASLQFSDVETVFFGFSDPTDRVSERVMELYGDESVPIEITAGLADESTVHVEVRSDASEEPGQGTPGVRCFAYRVDDATQQAHLEDLTSSGCSGIASEEDA